MEQTPGDSEGQDSLACCHARGCKEQDMTLVIEQQQEKNTSSKEPEKEESEEKEKFKRTWCHESQDIKCFKER